MLKRHEIQVLRRAGHSHVDAARLAGVARRTVQRVDTEATVAHIDTARERAGEESAVGIAGPLCLLRDRGRGQAPCARLRPLEGVMSIDLTDVQPDARLKRLPLANARCARRELVLRAKPADVVSDGRCTIFGGIPNGPPAGWGRVLHDDNPAHAIVDLILERWRVLAPDGPLMRTKDLWLEDPSGIRHRLSRQRLWGRRQSVRNPAATMSGTHTSVESASVSSACGAHTH